MDTVEVSGADFTTFEIPLQMAGADIEQAGAWPDGSFLLSGEDLDVAYTPLSLTFNGTRH